MKKSMLFIITLLLIPSYLYSETGPLRVGISTMIPCVMENSKGDYVGFDIDIWECVARDIGIDWKYEKVEFSELLKGVENGRFDIGLGAISITSYREKKLDFTHPYIRSGVSVVIHKESKRPKSLFKYSKNIFNVLKPLLICLLFLAHVLWLTERGRNSAINDKYFPGIAEATWCAIATMTTVGYGDIAPRKWPGRISAFVVMIIGIGYFGIIMAKLTATITTDNINDNIENLSDLRGNVIATVGGTTSEKMLNELGMSIKTYPCEEQAYKALLSKSVSCVVFDTPSVNYFAKYKGGNKVEVIGKIFAPQYYGFVLPQNNPLRNSINQSILQISESGEYERIYNYWF